MSLLYNSISVTIITYRQPATVYICVRDTGSETSSDGDVIPRVWSGAVVGWPGCDVGIVVLSPFCVLSGVVPTGLAVCVPRAEGMYV